VSGEGSGSEAKLGVNKTGSWGVNDECLQPQGRVCWERFDVVCGSLSAKMPMNRAG